VRYEGLSDKAAIRIPVALDGVTYWFQLDTGSDGTMLYGSREARRRGWTETDQGFVRIQDVRAGGTSLGPARIWLRKGEDPEDETIGTVGLNFLIGYFVILDFPRRRFCLLPRLDVPEELLASVASVPAEVRDGKFFVKPDIAGTRLEAVFYDTGSSGFSLVVDLALWKRLTGRLSGDEATHKIEIPSWGKLVPMFGAPAQGSLEIGPIRAEQPLVYYWGHQPEFFTSWPFQATGLIGNALLLEYVVVLDLGARPTFGILR
jgi:hypothetical protein